MDHLDVNSYLDSFINFESKLHQLAPEDFDLNRIKKFLKLAGSPEESLKIIHVAGTKGKGSTCAFLASILQQAGFSVGLYTSPHLHRVNERIRILNKDNRSSKEDFFGSISEDELAKVLTELRPLAADIINEGNILTYFEVLTVAAISYFAKTKVDVVILETGLGGRLDATNAVHSMLAIITPISFDHTKILGSTLTQIAIEKAGIIKNSHQQVVIAPQEKEAMDIILNRCKEIGIHPILVNPGKYKNLKPGLKGQHQILNASVAIEAMGVLRSLGYNISEESQHEGLKKVRWPGRFEIIRENPTVIVDGAHNEASARALAWTIRQEYPHRRIIMVLGISQDKDVMAICNQFKNIISHVILSKVHHPRAHIFTDAQGKIFGEKKYEIIEKLPNAIEKALKMAEAQDVIVITGSIFMVAEARNTHRGRLSIAQIKD